MDQGALDLIQQTAIAADTKFWTRLPANAVALPKDYTLHDLQQYMPGRRRFRGSMLTASIADFVAFVKRENGGAGFIDGEQQSATVFFNLGTKEQPGHGDHTAMLKLKPTAAYVSLCALANTRFDQRQLIDWMEDWSANLAAYGEDPSMPKSLGEAIAAVRQVTIKATKEVENTTQDFRGTRSTLEDIEAKSRVGLPGGFFFRCEPYLGLAAREFRLRLAVLTGGDKPVLTLRVVQKEAHDESIAEEFKAVLIREIGETATLTIGTFKP